MTKKVLEFLAPKELAEKLYNTKVGVNIYFTFDTKEDVEANDGEAEGWFGIKQLRIFDDYEPLVAIGYMGGGCTRVFDLFAETVFSEYEDKSEWISMVEGCLNEYIELDHSNYFNGCLCVEIKDGE